MKQTEPIAVTSRSFSRNPILRAELLERYENVAFNDEGLTLAGPALVQFLAGRVKAITALERIDDSILAELPDLRVVSKVGVGLDMIDVDALRRRNVRLAWTPGTNRRSVSELVLALAISLLRKLPEATALARAGEWRQPLGRCLSGRTVGIVGYGNVGRDLATLLCALECSVLAYDQHPISDEGVEQAELDELLARADVVSLHLDLNPATARIIDERRLALMKPEAILVNTARGGLVDEEALKRALAAGRPAGAAFDVFATEPPGDAELIALPNFIATPHIGGSTEEAGLAMGRAAIAGLDAEDPAS